MHEPHPSVADKRRTFRAARPAIDKAGGDSLLVGRAAKLIADEGRFDGFASAASGADLNAMFRAEP